MSDKKFKLDEQMLVKYSEKFDKKYSNFVQSNLDFKNKVISKIKETEKKLNKWQETNSDKLANLFVYIFRYIFSRQLKIWLYKRLRHIARHLDDHLFVLERNYEKIEKYLAQNSSAKIKIFVLWKELRWQAIELEEINLEALYYIYYLKDKLLVIESILDWIDNVGENILNDKIFYEKLESILEKLSQFIFIIFEKNKEKSNKEKENDDYIERKISIISELSSIVKETIKKITVLVTEYKKFTATDNSIGRSIVDYMNKYSKYKDVLEQYYNRLYNKTITTELNYTFTVKIEE